MKHFYLQSKTSDYISKYGEISYSNITEKKSKFDSYIFNIESEDKALKHIDIIRKNSKDARHIVYIYSYLNNGIKNIRFSDDGEPQGTGTKGILETIDKENITNICVVIVRYFGGILLGSGLLARTYLNSFKFGIKNCIKQEIYFYTKKNIVCSYSDYKKLNILIEKYSLSNLLIIKNINFNDKVEIILNIEVNNSKQIEEEILNIVR